MARRHISQLVEDMTSCIGLAAEDSARETVDLMKKLSSGHLSRAESAAMDYAYAQRHAFPKRDPGIINVLHDIFRQSWKFARKGVGSYLVFNTSRVARWLEEGTKGFRSGRGANSGMIPRPINKGWEVETKMAIIREKNLHRRLRQFLG